MQHQATAAKPSLKSRQPFLFHGCSEKFMLVFFNTKKVETIFVSDSHSEKLLPLFFDNEKVETILVADSHSEFFLLLFSIMKKLKLF